MKEARDPVLIFHINKHFNDLKEDTENIISFEDFAFSKQIRRAILFDFLQIGELSNQLSKAFRREFGNPNMDRLIAMRNRIVHGYSEIRDDIVFDVVKNGLPPLISDLNVFARAYFREKLIQRLGEKVTVAIDRFDEKRGENQKILVSEGYVDEITTLEGRFQDAYFMSRQDATEKMNGIITAIIQCDDEIKDILIVVDPKDNFSAKEIEEETKARERSPRKYIIRYS